MAKRSNDKPTIIVRRTARGLSPVSGFDAEMLAMMTLGAEFDVVPRSRRSLPQHRTYWKALALVVNATEAWPTTGHLHRAVKRALGYVSSVKNLDGSVSEEVDSISFEAMSQDEFKVYFDRAMQCIAEETGIDPLSFLAEAA